MQCLCKKKITIGLAESATLSLHIVCTAMHMLFATQAQPRPPFRLVHRAPSSKSEARLVPCKQTLSNLYTSGPCSDRPLVLNADNKQGHAPTLPF